ncbi:MAG: MAPEG family protein [Pseudomonadota bacterium]|nr:MAPEG family protein [Pseudomonadota bacterium]
MPVALACLLGFVAWTLLLVFLLISWRSMEALLGRRRLDEFPAGVPHGTDAYWRLNRAHANCVENLPLFGAVVLVAHALGADVGGLACVYLGARVAQSVTHVASGAPAAVFVRATFYTVQLGLLGAMIAGLAWG